MLQFSIQELCCSSVSKSCVEVQFPRVVTVPRVVTFPGVDWIQEKLIGGSLPKLDSVESQFVVLSWILSIKI